MEILFPCTSISGTEGVPVQVFPEVTPPGLIQLEALPVKANPFKVPSLLLEVKSSKVVTPLLDPLAIP